MIWMARQDIFRPPLSPRALERKIRALDPWFHHMNLGGVPTAPEHFLGDYPTIKWQRFQHAIPTDLSEKTVLDIGCNAGFYAIEMKRRHAKRVVGIDSDERYLRQAALATRILGVDIELAKLSVYQVAELREQFDVVLFMGVLYHLRHPLLALDLIYDHVAKDTLIFQSMLRGDCIPFRSEVDYPYEHTATFNQPGFPRLHFVENHYANDPTNWWIPNLSCVEAMLRSAGFIIVDHPEDEIFVCRRGPTRSRDAWGTSQQVNKSASQIARSGPIKHSV